MYTARIDLTLTQEGRHLTFSKELLEMAHIFRRVGGDAGPWQRVAVNARSPYLDTDVFAPGTRLEYYVQYATQQDAPEERSHIVSIALP
ncbi:MAG TPA: hypothetical protein VF629_01165 [Hymenobacter sp.]|jgi:hypothetical protein|uniref:hypothetical protein n=1 Tax=Hymenobacter sp. TaxID=1898978 RepID=UPI002EDB4AC9